MDFALIKGQDGCEYWATPWELCDEEQEKYGRSDIPSWIIRNNKIEFLPKSEWSDELDLGFD